MSEIETVNLVLAGGAGLLVLFAAYRAIDRLRRSWRRTKRTWKRRWETTRTITYWVTSPIWGPIDLGRLLANRIWPDPEEIKRGTKVDELRQYIERRDACTCQVRIKCDGAYIGEPGNPLQLHHWLPFNHFPWLDMCPWNLVLCCRKCNLHLSDDVPPEARNWDRGGEVICNSKEMAERRYAPKRWLEAA